MSNTALDPSEVARRITEDDAEDLFVLDIRNEDAYEEWQISGSANLPIYDDLLDYDYSTLETHLDDLPEDEEIAVVCIGGLTSARAAEFLREHGFDAASVENGMNGWGRVHREYDGTTDGVIQVVRPGTGCVSYLVHDNGEAIVVDPTQYIDQYLDIADAHGLSIVGVADTHAHADHVSGARRLAGELDIPYYLHESDAGELDDVTEDRGARSGLLVVGRRQVLGRRLPRDGAGDSLGGRFGIVDRLGGGRGVGVDPALEAVIALPVGIEAGDRSRRDRIATNPAQFHCEPRRPPVDRLLVGGSERLGTGLVDDDREVGRADPRRLLVVDAHVEILECRQNCLCCRSTPHNFHYRTHDSE